MKICFLARPIYDRVSTKVFNCLMNDYDSDIEGIFITMNSKETEYVKSCVKNADIREINTYIKKHWSEFDISRLIQYEEKYECAPIWSYIYTDRFLINRDYDYVIKMTVGLFSFFEEIYRENRVDFYYSEAIATLLCYVSYIVGKHYGVQYVAQIGARGLDSTHHYILNDPFQGNAKMEENYEIIKFSEEERRFADEFLREFEEKDIKPSYMIKNGAVPRLKPEYLKLPIKRFLKKYSKEFNDPYSYIYYQGQKGITDPIKFYFRYRKGKKYYHPADFTKKYVYFPLHFQPEASTIVCAAKYEKQLYYIDSWAKSLPADTMLYVKEHYAVLGHRDLHFYEELKKYPNVLLIDPYESSRKLSENAYAVTTLTGTAGWEAMLLRKPVFIGGNIFFENAPGVIKVSDVYQNFVKTIEHWKKPEREDVLQYLCSYFRSLRKGSISRIWDTEDENNVKEVTESLFLYLQEAHKQTK